MDLTLHALIDHRRVPGEQVEAFLQEAQAGGVSVVQLREKEGATRTMLSYGERVRTIARKLGLLFAVNDRLDLALALEADILHVGRDDLPIGVVRRLAPGLALGISASSPDEIPPAIAERPDYIGFGPVFSTPSKTDAAPPSGAVGLAQAVRLAAGCPVVAIGGITGQNAQEVWSTGAHGLAVISALTDARDVRQAARMLCRRD